MAWLQLDRGGKWTCYAGTAKGLLKYSGKQTRSTVWLLEREDEWTGYSGTESGKYSGYSGT